MGLLTKSRDIMPRLWVVDQRHVVLLVVLFIDLLLFYAMLGTYVWRVDQYDEVAIPTLTYWCAFIGPPAAWLVCPLSAVVGSAKHSHQILVFSQVAAVFGFAMSLMTFMCLKLLFDWSSYLWGGVVTVEFGVAVFACFVALICHVILMVTTHKRRVQIEEEGAGLMQSRVGILWSDDESDDDEQAAILPTQPHVSHVLFASVSEMSTIMKDPFQLKYIVKAK
eukprot:c3863_g1_i1.p1 GENE.c3863_g1_i1~~c3863_g1_i1.p1  ORF type:complete len:222 (+),score=54.74 c3863_g1_i1:2-667(+)